MKARTQALVAVGAAAALFLVAFATGRRVRAPEDPDPRASTFATGRAGVSGLYEATRRLGVAVERWRERPSRYASRAGDDTLGRRTTFAVVAPSRPLSSGERAAIAQLVATSRGSNLLLAGEPSEEAMRCLGYAVETSVFDSMRVRAPGAAPDSAAAWAHAQLVPLGDSARRGARTSRAFLDGVPCPSVAIRAVDTLLVTPKGRPVMLRLTASGGRRALLVADDALLRNRTMRLSSTGPLVLDAVRAMGERLVFDEYHHGYRAGGSMAGVALAWSARHPLGWMVWQLVAVGLLALLFGAARFGPVRAAIVRQRRSPLEHVRALATALAAAGGHREAVAAMVRGLRRRLAAGAGGPTGRDDWRPWLDQLVANAPTPRVRESAERLQRLANDRQQAIPETAVLGAAHAVEDVWHSLRP